MQNRFKLTWVCLSLFGVYLTVGMAGADAPPPSTQPVDDSAKLYDQFEKTMSHAVLKGRFTIDGDDSPAKEDSYTIVSVRKLKGDLWLLNARIQFGTKDVTVPLILPIKWAGDTPVITVTNIGVPGIGSYSARVLIDKDHYAGTWSGGPTHQGTLYGRISHPATTEPAAK